MSPSIGAPSPDAAYQEQVTDETNGETSSVLVLNSAGDGPLTPEFDAQQIGNAPGPAALFGEGVTE